MLTTELAEDAREITRRWWLFLLTGVLWIIYAFVVLSATINTVWAVAVMFGIGFIVGGAFELMLAFVADSWRWLHAIFGVISIGAGIVALVWPGQTFLVLAAIIGWFLMLDGIMSITTAIISREVNHLWWLGLIVGIAEVVIGFWAVGYVGRSVALLVIWVGAAALARGISDLVLGFSLHGADKKLRGLLERRPA